MAEADKKLWQEVAVMLLDGVIFHDNMMEEYRMHDLCGFAHLHKHAAMEEFANYMHIQGDYVKLYKTKVDSSTVTNSLVKLVGATVEEKIENGLDVYETWEKGVYAKLKAFKNKIEDYNNELDYLIEDVKKELYCIRRMQDDVAEMKHMELEEWLNKKYGEE